jgi:hypothetical protein
MCIIAAKPAGVKMPDLDTIERMWYGNPDGAGIMYALDGKVHIEKGLMTLLAVEAKLEELSKTVDLDNTGVVMHFRITTHGGTRPENTHPFPITDSIKMLQRTKVTTSIGVAHNGIIDITPRSKDISDTMEYIAAQLAPLSRALPEWYHNADALTLVKNGIQSKMAVLTGTGEIVTIGDFVEHDGIQYSNHSFESWGKYRFGNYSYYCGMDDYDDACWTTAHSAKSDKTTATSTGKSKSKPTGKCVKKSGAPLKLAEHMPEPSPLVISVALMWIPEKDPAAFVSDDKGELKDAEDYFLDRKGNVYEYDYDGMYAVECPGYTAFTGTGLPIDFDDDYASLECVLDEDTAPWWSKT